ncbi:MAG: IS30 family transposase [Actinobacteria bacterium]|nr:IS30 family transposase [Actinomycetota bacterium]
MPGPRLTLEERKVIQNGFAGGLTQQQIAAAIGRSQATVCRELKRNHNMWAGPVSPLAMTPRARQRAAYRHTYRADNAHRKAGERARRPKPRRLANPLLAFLVDRMLRQDWSPQQIAAILPRWFPDRPELRVSHETIYQTLFVQSRGELRRELTRHLRSGQTQRKPQGHTERRGRLFAMIPISARPPEVADRAVPGHWEGDLLLGARGKGAVITLVERTSRFVMLAPLPGRHTADLTRDALTMLITRLPEQLRSSVTWDQGREMAYHAEFSVNAGVTVYFCDPHSPWQRGTNENTNGLLRQYLPKGCDMRQLTQADCDAIAARLNTRPRQTLDWQTPAQTLNQALHATAA